MIYESIITTVSQNKEPHIAPFGVQWSEGMVKIAPFKPSKTLDNILNSGVAVLNLTDDVRVFAAAIARKSEFKIQTLATDEGVRLKDCLAYHFLKLQSVDEDMQRPSLWMTLQYSVIEKPFMGFNRAQAAVIELAVLVSRLNLLPIEKILQEMHYLQAAIDKTAGPHELQAWQWLVDSVNNHVAQQTGMQQG